MASLNMEGPFDLDVESVSDVINRASAGNYALGKVNKATGNFVVAYVGRSDSDLKDRLTHWANESGHPLFKYSYASSAKQAFEKECTNYHDFEPSENEIHPDKPENSNYACPVCGK